ncbi:MAG: glycerol kinase GlpK [Cyanobacteria bacterium J06627_8]
MPTQNYIMALDLGTTGNRAIIFNRDGAIAGQGYKELTQYYPNPGWLEHDPREIWADIQWAMQTAVKKAQINASEIAAIGLTVQRETCLLWDKTTGRPLHNAIVWQDRRTTDMCQQLQANGKAQEIRDRTGLVLDAYFSATKLAWLLNKVKDIQDPPSDFDDMLAGTIDTWVLWNLTNGKVHATDHSNASRTMVLNLESSEWDNTLLDLFQIPRQLMPEIKPSLGLFGVTDPKILGVEIPVMAILGDQQSALYGHGCDHPGSLKCTYGTGAFLVAHTGTEIAWSKNKLLSTVAWSQTHQNGDLEISYALEGSMFTAGACIQWLRDGVQVITSAGATEDLSLAVSDNGGLYFVPALSGLGAPHWDMGARGAFLGITGGVQREHMVRSVLEAIAYQVKEVVDAVNEDSDTKIQALTVDGGACQNNFLMQFQADVLGIPVKRPAVIDVTAQGAAFAAGLASGFWDNYSTLVSARTMDRVFEPGVGAAQAQDNFLIWQKAVNRAKQWID